MPKTTFFVPGLPAPKGSTRAFLNKWTGRIAVTADNRVTQKAWQSSVTALASIHLRGPTAGPVWIGASFIMPRPKSLPKRVQHHLKKPDYDKLLRCVLDGLTGIAYRDDAQVVGRVEPDGKRYAMPGEMTGCHITVVTEEEPCTKPR